MHYFRLSFPLNIMQWEFTVQYPRSTWLRMIQARPSISWAHASPQRYPYLLVFERCTLVKTRDPLTIFGSSVYTSKPREYLVICWSQQTEKLRTHSPSSRKDSDPGQVCKYQCSCDSSSPILLHTNNGSNITSRDLLFITPLMKSQNIYQYKYNNEQLEVVQQYIKT